MLCSISGAVPRAPVVSKSGYIYEKDLAEEYIQENGREPVTGEPHTKDELVRVQTSHVAPEVTPRPPTLSSIPGLLGALQNEWDSCALETFQLRQQLAQTRRELSSSLYHYDAAVRVVARLTRERDEARQALEALAGAGQSAHTKADNKTEKGESRDPEHDHVDRDPLATFVSELEARRSQLSSARRQRTVSRVDPESPKIARTAVEGGITVSARDQYALVTFSPSRAAVYAVPEMEIAVELRNHTDAVASREQVTQVTCGVWTKHSISVLGYVDGHVSFFNNDGSVLWSADMTASITFLDALPLDHVIACVAGDQLSLYDLSTQETVHRARLSGCSEAACAGVHPDGTFLAVGQPQDKRILVFDLSHVGRSRESTRDVLESVAQFAVDVPARGLSFSENGYWLAVAVTQRVLIVDLRNVAKNTYVDVGVDAGHVAFDPSGRVLAVGGAGGVVLVAYDKSQRAWSQPKPLVSEPCSDLCWSDALYVLTNADLLRVEHVTQT